MDTATFERFFLPSEALTARIADRVESLEFEATRALEEKPEYAEPLDSSLGDVSPEDLGDTGFPDGNSDQEVMLQRRMLAEPLYYYLAKLSENPEDTGAEGLNVREAIAQEMGAVLGLPDDDALSKELSEEFQSWIAETGIFTAGWGNIIWAGVGHIHLEAFLVDVDTSTQPPDLSFVHEYPGKTEDPKPGVLAAVSGLYRSIFVRKPVSRSQDTTPVANSSSKT